MGVFIDIPGGSAESGDPIIYNKDGIAGGVITFNYNVVWDPSYTRDGGEPYANLHPSDWSPWHPIYYAGYNYIGRDETYPTFDENNPDSYAKRSPFLDQFNCRVEIPEGIENLQSAFYSLNSFNQPITIPESAVNCANMFWACKTLKQDIYIPNSVTNVVGMFYGCNSMTSDITITMPERFNSISWYGCTASRIYY